MKLLDAYIMRNFLLGMAPVLLLLLILFSFIALADELEDVGQGLYTQFDAFMVVLYTAPRRMVDLLPVSTLLGGLIGLGAMANQQELIAARVAGMSRPRLARPVLILAMCIAALVVLAQSSLVPASELKANELRAKSLVQTSMEAGGDLDFWTRSGKHIVHVNDVRFGRLLSDIEIYSTDERGRLEQLVQAEQASISGVDNWLLDNVVITRVEGPVAVEERREELSWPALLSVDQAAILVLPLESLAPLDLSRLIRFQRDNGLDTHNYRVVLWQQLSIAVAIVGMALLALPMLLGSIRSIPAGQRVVIGGVIGIAFYLLQQLSGHVAGLFKLNPPVVIMAPAVAVLLVGVYAQFLDAARKRRALRKSSLKKVTA